MTKEIDKNIVDVNLPDIMEKLYVGYSEETILSRALARIEDGLKPIQRYVLYSMLESGLKANAKPRKCAKVVGQIIGMYSPHGLK